MKNCNGLVRVNPATILNMRVLGIETSCDETGLAVYDNDAGLLSHALYSQVNLHKTYGGVVPELASRDHIRRVIPLIKEVLGNAGLEKDQLDGIAYTAGPGLIGALLVGVAIGQGLAYGLGKPAIGIHHMEGHLLAPMLEAESPGFPFIALLVSGGHTQLVKVNRPFDYLMLGQSMDDAAGEALDKTAKLLGLPYPGGPELARLAETGDPDRFRFPRPMTNRPGLDFSFSGLKTFAINTYQTHKDDPDIAADIARAFLEAVVDTLCIKCKRAMDVTGIKTIVAAGGVSANRQLRQSLDALTTEAGGRVYYPRTEFCTDNGAMIAYAGSLRLAAGEFESLSFTARPRWPLC